MEIQSSLILLLKKRIRKDEVLVSLISDILCLGIDASYRRIRCQNLFTSNEFKKNSWYFEISLNALFQLSKRNVTFTYSPLKKFTSYMESYLKEIRDSFLFVKNQGSLELIITMNNTRNTLNNIISSSSKTNEKERNAFFEEVINLIEIYKKKIKLDLE